MARPSGAKTRCSGKWTEARFNSFIKSLLRQGTRRWAPIQEVKREARTRRGFYRCAGCKQEVPATIIIDGKRVNNAIVDHTVPIVSVREGFLDWDETIERMFAEKDNLQLLCYSCHTEKTNGERAEASTWRGARKDHHSAYNSWKSMMARCLHEHHHAYPRYGGRGISVEERWEDFWEFLRDMGDRPAGTSLDRIDNDGDYCPENCRWATREEQANNRSSSLLLEIDGEVRTLSQWSLELGIPVSTLGNRLSRGSSPEEALTTDFVKGKRPAVLPYESIYEDANKGLSWEELAEKYGCHKDTARKYVQKRKKEESRNE